MRLRPEPYDELVVVEPQRHLPEITHLDELAQEADERRAEVHERPWKAADRQPRISDNAADRMRDLDPGLDPVSGEMEHLEGGWLVLDRGEPRKRFGKIGQIRPRVP